MKHKYLYITPFFIFGIVLFFLFSCAVPSYAWSGSARNSIYSSNELNQQTIRNWDNLTEGERAYICEQIFPYITQVFGFNSKGNTYDVVSAYWNGLKAIRISLYPDATDYIEGNHIFEDGLDKRLFVYGAENDDGQIYYFYYDTFAEWLAKNVHFDSDNLVVDDASPSLNGLLVNYVDNYASDNGIIQTDILSYHNINSSNFVNLTAYNNFIELCNSHVNSQYVVCMKHSSGQTWWGSGGPLSTTFLVAFPHEKVNLYNNGDTVGNTLNFLTDNGSPFYTFDVFLLHSDNTFVQHGTVSIRNCKLGTVTLSNSTDWSITNGFLANGLSLYSTYSDTTTFNLYTSVNGWIDNHGHFEYPFTTTGFFGSVPSATISSQDLTNYYNYTYTDNSVVNNYNTSPDITSPDAFEKGDDESSFHWVSRILGYIGDFIKDIITGIGDLILSVVEGIGSALSNLVNLILTDNPIIEFLTVFMSWLPEPIPQILIALFALGALFGLFKLIKGVFS